MSKIKTHQKERIVIDETYETTDGRVFTEIGLAENHQAILDGKRITCPACNGQKGKYQDTSPINYDLGGYHAPPKIEFVPCEKCNGRGYLELKFA